MVARRENANGYFSLDPQNGQIQFESRIPSVDLLPWLIKLLKPMKFSSPQSAILVTNNLPKPMSNMKLTIHLNSLDMTDEVATFSLQKQKKLVAQLQLWRKITKKKKIKQLPKSFKRQDKFEQELLLDSPTAMFISSSGFDYEHILLSLVNCYLLFMDAIFKQ